MKKAISVLLILAMVMVLSACGKKETPANQDNTTVTQAPDPTKEPDPTKPAATPEPTSTPTPTPTPEPTSTPVPTEAPVDDIPDDEFDEFGDEYASGYEGIWQSDNCILQIDREGTADILTFYFEETDKKTYGGYNEFWTNFIGEEQRFVSHDGKGRHFYYEDGEQFSEEIEGLDFVEVSGDNLIWAEMTFEKISDDTSDNPYFNNPYADDGYYSGDVGDGFGAEFTLEHPQAVDVVVTTFYGVYCDSWDYANTSFYYPYYGDEMSMDTMDEFNAAYLELGAEGDEGHLCFLEKGMNGDIQWTINDGTLNIMYVPTGEEYTGLFYWDSAGERLYVCIRIDEYDVWMTYKTDIVISSDFVLSDEAALSAIETYCLETITGLQRMVDNDEYNIWWMVESSNEDQVVVLYRSYTGAYVRYYVDRVSGDTYVTEFVPTVHDEEQMTEERLNAWEYWR